MSNETKIMLINRLKSLAWRVGNFAAVAVLAFISENIGLLELPLWMIALIGLVSAEGTKWLNSRPK